ncbi:hypothetical protein Trydic_g12852 [Trypoxylus dichotomus]
MPLFPLVLVMVSTIVTSAIATEEYDCPEQCSCEPVRRYAPPSPEKEKVFVHARCRMPFNLTELPNSAEKITFEHPTSIDLEEFLDDLDASFGLLPALTALDFANCSFNTSNVTFNAERITHLSLRSGDLSSTPEFRLAKLETLDLSNNRIRTFEYAPYRTLGNLQVLNLSANGAYSVKDGYFEGLTNLKCLDLSNNKFSVLTDEVLLPLSNLQYLNLSNNRLEILNEACFSSLLRLQQLDVSWNRLAKVVPGNLELPSLARLLLAGNPKLGNSRKPTLLVGTGRRLQTVDASRTGLRQVPAALTHSIRVLRLAGNSIKSVNCGDLDTYPLLQVLDFASNELKQIEDDALGRLDSLTVLYLTDNRLPGIPKSLPEKLKVLHLERNKIKTIQSADLQNLNQLEVLLLCDNKITTIEENSFNHLLSLVSLDLSRNPINILPPGLLTTSGKLEILKLSGIPASPQLGEAAFPLASTEYLIVLDLSKSPGLAHQLLGDTAALMAARELQELDLADTDIEFIRPDLLHYLSQLRLLHLQGNPLNCSNLYWLAVWMRKQDEEEYAKVSCVSPAELWSIPLVDLQEMEDEKEFITEKVFEKKSSTKIDYNFTYFTETKILQRPLNLELINEDINKNEAATTEISTKDYLNLPNLFRNNTDNKSREYEIYDNENATTSTGKLSMYCASNNYDKILAHPDNA